MLYHNYFLVSHTIIKVEVERSFIDSHMFNNEQTSTKMLEWNIPITKHWKMHSFFFSSKIFLISIKKNMWTLQLKLMCPKAYNFHVQWWYTIILRQLELCKRFFFFFAFCHASLLIKKGSKEVDSSIEALELTQRIGVTFSISEGASSFSCSQSLVNPACCHTSHELLPPSSPISHARHLRDTDMLHHNVSCIYISIMPITLL